MSNEIVTTAQKELTPMMRVIEAAVMSPEVDAGKMKQLLDIQITIMDREAKQAFSAAMASCQKEMPLIVRTAENQQTNSSYAKHEVICKMIKPVYTKHGFSLTFHEGKADVDGEIRTICDVEHEMGHSKQYYIDLPKDNAGIKGNVNKTPVHAKGSTFSYGRRYLTLMIFDLATYDDNDANVAPTITEEQVLILHSKITDNNIPLDKFLAYIKTQDIGAIPAKAFDYVNRELDATIKNRQSKKTA